jgi:lipid-binding SYLF domain-containing protein
VVKEVLNTSGGIPQTTFDKAVCIVVYPSVEKIGAGVGVTYGRRVLSCRVGLLPGGAWSAPAMYTLDAGSIRPQFGGSSTEYVVFVMTETAAEKVLSGKVKLAADAGAYLGSSGPPRKD